MKENEQPKRKDFENEDDYTLAYMEYICVMYPEFRGGYIEATIKNNIKAKNANKNNSPK